MADRYAFQSPFARDDDNAWFRVGGFPVTTTAAVSSLAIIGIFILAIEGNGGFVGRNFSLSTEALTGGQIWRLITWPVVIIFSDEIFWQLLGAIFFFMIGSQFERVLGRTRFFTLVASITVLSGIVGVIVGLLTNTATFQTSLHVLFVGVAAGFAAAFTKAQSFFGIPFWVLVAVIGVVDVLRALADRNWPLLAMVIFASALGLVLTRSFGFAEEVDWIPAIALPASLTGEAVPAGPKPRRKKASKNKAGLRSVPMPAASEAEIDALLDQVAEEGIGSLTKEQKATLKRHSEAMRRKRDED